MSWFPSLLKFQRWLPFMDHHHRMVVKQLILLQGLGTLKSQPKLLQLSISANNPNNRIKPYQWEMRNLSTWKVVACFCKRLLARSLTSKSIRSIHHLQRVKAARPIIIIKWREVTTLHRTWLPLPLKLNSSSLHYLAQCQALPEAQNLPCPFQLRVQSNETGMLLTISQLHLAQWQPVLQWCQAITRLRRKYRSLWRRCTFERVRFLVI